MSKNSSIRKILVLLFAIGLTIFIRIQNKPVEIYMLRGEVFGTYYQIRIPKTEKISTDLLEQEIESFFEGFNREFSTYDPDSFISHFNASTDTSIWHPVSSRMRQVISKSFELHKWSGGYFDITLEPLLDAWGFNRSEFIDMDPQAVKSRLTGITWGMKNLELSENGIRKRSPFCRLNLNALAKGFAIDLLKKLLEGRNLKHFLIEIGGEIHAHGFADGKNMPWKIGIEAPVYDREMGETMAGFIELTDKALATSGNYRQFFNDGESYFGHIINPLTGLPTTHQTISVTLIAPDCMTADGLATALLAMGAEHASTLIMPVDCEAMWLAWSDTKPVVNKTDGFPILKTL